MQKKIILILTALVLSSTISYAGDKVIITVDEVPSSPQSSLMSVKEKEKIRKEAESKQKAAERKEKVEATKQKLRDTFKKSQ